MSKDKKIFFNQGFTIVELIVIMAVIAILVFLGSLGYKGYTKQAQMTRLQYDARVLSDACQRFYVDNGDYPRLSDTPYTSDQVNAFATKVYDQKGIVISLDGGGSYYDLDFSKLKKYVSVKEDSSNFVLQNPVGDIYFLEPSSNTRLQENAGLKPASPTLTVDTTNNPPAYNVVYPTGITPQETEYQLDGGAVVTSAPVDLLSAGNHNIKVRYKYNNYYSDWVSVDFSVINGVIQVSAGNDYTVALMRDGTVKAWGRNLYGQLGIATNSGTNNPNPTPVSVPGLTGVKQISAGVYHTIALMEDGTVKAWGWNRYGQLGISVNSGTDVLCSTPTTVPNLTGVKQISAGGNHSVALMEDGTIKTWGYNYSGQLGVSTNSGKTNPNPTPTTVSNLTGVKQISAGGNQTAALMQDDTVKAWGSNSFGQLGTSTNNGVDIANPTPTTVPNLTGVKQIIQGTYHTIAIMQDETVKAWGWNKCGQLGSTVNNGTSNPNPTPTTILNLTGVKQICAYSSHTIALMEDGTVKSFGNNQYGQLGTTTNIGTANPNPLPTIIPSLINVKQIITGGNHTIAIMEDGTVKTWGSNQYGQLGAITNSGTTNPNPTPTTISGF